MKYFFILLILASCSPQTLSGVNSSINVYRYVPDLENYGVTDYWASPREFRVRGGDCEDYAIAKQERLDTLGFTDTHIIIVSIKKTGVAHALLRVKEEGEFKYLDSRIDKILSIDEMEEEYVFLYFKEYKENS